MSAEGNLPHDGASLLRFKQHSTVTASPFTPTALVLLDVCSPRQTCAYGSYSSEFVRVYEVQGSRSGACPIVLTIAYDGQLKCPTLVDMCLFAKLRPMFDASAHMYGLCMLPLGSPEPTHGTGKAVYFSNFPKTAIV
eukprot:6172413-Pleurochrysis_carterae.AAC.4